MITKSMMAVRGTTVNIIVKAKYIENRYLDVKYYHIDKHWNIFKVQDLENVHNSIFS